MMHEMTSIGTGKMIVELFSAEMLFRVCRYRSWRAAGLSATTSAACLRALLALCSPSAAITLALASLAASASAAMALISCSGTLTSFTSTLSTVTPQGSVASCSSSCISLAMDSRSDKMSPRFLVPNTFLIVAADQSEASIQVTR